VKPPVSVAVPPAVVTTTSTAPALPEGVVTTIEPAVSEVTVPGLPPKVTELAEDRLVPSMVTLVPPAVGPEPGLTEVMVGAET